VVASEPFRNKPKAFKMKWACCPQDTKHVPNPSTGVCCVALFRKDRELYAAASWKSDTANGGKMRFFALDERQVAAKSMLDFPDTVSALSRRNCVAL
jgi:hypothetical protein